MINGFSWANLLSPSINYIQFLYSRYIHRLHFWENKFIAAPRGLWLGHVGDLYRSGDSLIYYGAAHRSC